MFTPKYKVIPVEFIGDFKIELISTVTAIVNARVIKTVTDASYLQVIFPDNETYSILVEISEERKRGIRSRSIPIIFPFEQPEKGMIYLAQTSVDDKIEKLAYLYPIQKEFEWPLPGNIDFDFAFTESPKSFNLLAYSKERNKVSIEIVFDSEELIDNMKVWSFRNFLIPFSEVLKTAILSNNLGINSNSFEKKIKFGITRIDHKCLRAIFEFNYNPELHTENQALENICALYELLDADEEETIKKLVESFNNKKIVPDIIKILKVIIGKKATLKSSVSTPKEQYKELILNRSKAVTRKKIMEVSFPNDPYSLTVTGVLTRIDVEPNKPPMFALHDSESNEKYCGKIGEELLKSIDEISLNFINTIYECKLEVVFYPETSLSKEKTEYTLLDISEVNE